MEKKRVRDHIKDHLVLYSIGGTVLVAGITCLIMRSTVAQWGTSESNAQWGLTNTASFNFRNEQVINVTTVLDREGRGHPGWPVRNLETKRIFMSQKEAADSFRIPEGILSGHLNGKFDDANGLHFERVNLISS